MSVGKDSVIKIWNTSTWDCVSTLTGIQSDQYGCSMYKQARWSSTGDMLCVTNAVYVGWSG